jgi:hypothetical protein
MGLWRDYGSNEDLSACGAMVRSWGEFSSKITKRIIENVDKKHPP